MAHIMNVNELNENKNWKTLPNTPQTRSDKFKTAQRLVHNIKNAFKASELEIAGNMWTELYDLYSDTQNMDEKLEFFEIMHQFTDEEVFGITDYLREKEYRKQGM